MIEYFKLDLSEKITTFTVVRRFKCTLCGRDKFIKPTPHICGGQFRKRGLTYIEITDNKND